MSLSRRFLRGLLESPEGQQRIAEIFDEVTTKRTQQVWVEHQEVRKDGSVDIRKKPVDVEVYSLRDVISFLGFAAAYGVGKPPEEKNVNVRVTSRTIESASDEELEAVIEGRAVLELPAGS